MPFDCNFLSSAYSKEKTSQQYYPFHPTAFQGQVEVALQSPTHRYWHLQRECWWEGWSSAWWHMPEQIRVTHNSSPAEDAATFQYFITFSTMILGSREVPREPQCCGRWTQGPSSLPDITRKLVPKKTNLFTTLSTENWNKISSCLKSRAAVLLRMIRHATELYHSNYIRNKFTVWKKKKDYKKQSTKTAAVSQLRDMQRREMHYTGAAENEFNMQRAACC